MKIDRININNNNYNFKSKESKKDIGTQKTTNNESIKSGIIDNTSITSAMQGAAISKPVLKNQKDAMNDLGLSSTIIIPSVSAAAPVETAPVSTETTVIPAFIDSVSSIYASHNTDTVKADNIITTGNNSDTSLITLSGGKDTSTAAETATVVSGNPSGEPVTLTPHKDNDTVPSGETVDSGSVKENKQETDKTEVSKNENKQKSGSKLVRFFIDKIFG